MSDEKTLLSRLEAVEKECGYNQSHINSESTSRRNDNIKIAKAIKQLAQYIGVELATDLGDLE